MYKLLYIEVVSFINTYEFTCDKLSYIHTCFFLEYGVLNWGEEKKTKK